MTTHKEALRAAAKAVWERSGSILEDDDAETCIRAYLDARGLVMVPHMATNDMIAAADKDERERKAWGASINPGHTYSAMLAAAPDPFK